MQKVIYMPKITENPFPSKRAKTGDEAGLFNQHIKMVEDEWENILQTPGLETFLIDSQSGQTVRWEKENGTWEGFLLDEGMAPVRLNIPETQSIKTRLAWFSVGFTPTVILNIK